jgi:hypothetical protein
MRRELTVFIPTTDIDESELMIQTTKTEGVILLTLPNGSKVGVERELLEKALNELKWFKVLNPNKESIEPKKSGTVEPMIVEYVVSDQTSNGE